MTTITGIPAHALLVHAIVVLAPLTALLEISVRVLASGPSTIRVAGFGFRGGDLVLTPLTTEAGQWLYDQQSQPARSCRPTQSAATG